MGFSSQDDLVSEVTVQSKFNRIDWTKQTDAGWTATIGRWYDMNTMNGNPMNVEYGNIVVNGNFNGSIWNWTANGTNWVYGTNTAVKTSGTATTFSSDSVYIPVVAGRYYRVQYTLAWTSGTCTVSVGGTAGTGRGANGTFVEVLTATNTNGIVFTAAASTNVFTISAVSVVEWGTSSGTLTSSAQIITNTNCQGFPWHGGDVSTDTKHLLNMGAVSAVATSVPGVLYLCDFLLVYPFLDAASSTAQTLYNNNTLPRYTDGKGVRAFAIAQTGLGANAHNITINYTRATTGGTDTGRVMPVTVAGTASAIKGHITHAGVAANNYGPFLPLAAGDLGVKSVQEWKLSAATATANTYHALVLCKPLAALPITTASVMSERDFLNQIPSLPKIEDGAALGFLFFAGAALAASSNIYGYIESAWG